MTEFTEYLELAILNHVFGESGFATKTAHYVQLLTTVPPDTVSNVAALTEISGTGYTAGGTGPIEFGAATTHASGSFISGPTAAAITWTNGATTPWTIRAISISDSNATSGNVLCYTAITTATINQSEKIQFAQNDIDIYLD